MKKDKNYKPQNRRNTKPTTGYHTLVDVIYMEKEPDGVIGENGKEGERVFASCTCKEWRSSAEATTITKVALEAKAHAEETGHQLRRHFND